MSYYWWNSNGTLHTNLLIMKGYFRSVSQINTAPIHIVLSTHIPTQMEPNVIATKYVLGQEHCLVLCRT
jgi:hypothetical protein